MENLKITARDSRDQAVAWARELAEALKSGDPSADDGIQRAIEQFRAANFQIAILGKAKRGKSTLINALLGRHDDLVAPIDKLPASSAITRFSWSPIEAATVQFRGGGRESVSYARIREFTTEESNPQNVKQVEVVDVAGPFPGMDHDLILVDTPGAGSIHEHHDALLYGFIPQADAVIFLVTARMPIDQDELELLAHVKKADVNKIFFAVNRVDELNAGDIEAAVGHNQRLLRQIGIPAEKIYRVSAKAAFEGDLPSSGLAPLISDVRNYLAANKTRALRGRFLSRVQSIAGEALSTFDLQVSSGRKSVEDLDAELSALEQKKRHIESVRSLVEREFNLSWNSAVDDLERGLQAAKQNVLVEIDNRVGGSGLTEVSKLARRLPTIVNQTIDDKLQPSALAFEEKARTAAMKLDAGYPALMIGDGGAAVIRTRTGNELIAGSAGGILAAGAGVGLAAAGSATAASIAAANATALAATTTVAAPSAVAGLLTTFHLGFLAPLATGTATVAAPTAITVTPLWVALSGPVGWTLAGIGLLAVPFSWRISKVKFRDKLEDAAKEHVLGVFDRLKNERVTALREMGRTMVEEFRIRLDRELGKLEETLISARDRRFDTATLQKAEHLASRVRKLLSHQV